MPDQPAPHVSTATAPGTPQRLAFGDCVLDLHAQRLLRAGQPVPLPPRYYAVLVHLVGSGGRLVGKDELLDAVWGHRSVSDSALKVAINAVRAALGDSTKAPQHVETVSRRGYRFIAVVRSLEAGAQALPAAPPVVSARSVPAKGNLPAVQPGLIGREADLLHLQQALGAHRLVTLHGPGGVGKTRLALTAAGHEAPDDGVWLLRLETLSDAAPLLSAAARTLGLGVGADDSPAALARALAGLQLRLLIDNAEHLQPAVAELAAALLAGAPGVSMLVTSQLPLRVAGEEVLPLAPLRLPGADLPQAEDGAATTAQPALRLLLERARQHQAEAPADAAALADAVAICRVLDGLPLALELAAARVPLLGWAGVRQRLDASLGEAWAEGSGERAGEHTGDALSLLTRGRADAADRHRTLRAALSWTFGLLGPAEQQVLQALSVFAGSFSIEAALAAAAPAPGAVDAMDSLDTLRERALLVRASEAHPPRWRLYDSVRSFAAEGLQHSGQRTAVLRRLAGWLSAHFQAADAALGASPLRPWLNALQPEADNLQATLQALLADEALHNEAIMLFAASASFRVRSGYRRQAQQQYERISAWPPQRLQSLPPLAQAAFDLARAQLTAIGQVLLPQPALEAARRARAVYAAAGQLERQHAAMLLECALLMRLQAPVPQREALLAEMRAIEPVSWGPLQRRQRVWQELLLLRQQGDVEVFIARCREYMELWRSLGEENSLWVAAQGLAQVLCARQRLPEATALLQQTVDEMRQHGELRRNVQVLAQLAALRVMADGSPATAQLLQEAALLMRAEGRLWWMADALPWLPAWQGRWHAAVRVQAWADELVRQRGDLRGMLFGTLRQQFERWLAQQPEAAPLQSQLASTSATGLDEGGVLALVFPAASTLHLHASPIAR